MIRYRYNQQLSPPAPFVHVSLQGLEGSGAIADLPAQLDTAADMTVIPAALADRLGLVPFGTVQVSAFGGLLTTECTLLARVQIRDHEPEVVKLVSSADETHILLGRDVLNRHRLVLDGPRGVLEID
ncbi:MAG: retroviral-like aspartic protease family protein [Verrucomicrobia bacterium]|nr:retroviral-like aspartic protease family protein [Verrucomicrobiota bacterium]